MALWRHMDLFRKRLTQKLHLDEGTLARWEIGVARPTGTLLERAKDFFAANEPRQRYTKCLSHLL